MFIDVIGIGEMIVFGNFIGVLMNYVNVGLIGGNGVLGLVNLIIDIIKNFGFIMVYMLELLSLVLFGLVGFMLVGCCC